ncbi:hypothetical protein BDW74DRAFT_157170 [Aspergillus multicolor]|uniref:uncharacterized protein n=1 Tax=Aspergillus multicolor TaxID=41759 RepID=UPI003CCD5234
MQVSSHPKYWLVQKNISPASYEVELKQRTKNALVRLFWAKWSQTQSQSFRLMLSAEKAKPHSTSVHHIRGLVVLPSENQSLGTGLPAASAALAVFGLLKIGIIPSHCLSAGKSSLSLLGAQPHLLSGG